ncbi:MAG: thioredoxin family protein [Acidimicrobiales bacterium]
MELPDGLVVVVNRDCPTCVMVAPVLGDLLERSAEPVAVYTQDDPSFPDGIAAIDDTDLEVSWRLEIETVPTVIRVDAGREVERVVGWHRDRWQALTGVDRLGPDLPATRPGCGSLSVEPDLATALAVRFGGARLASRRVELASAEDEMEAFFDRGWSDGLPVVAPTEARVMRMLDGTTRAADEVVAVVPPALVKCTVEKAAINAVLAGCKPEYLPVVLAALEAACTDEFNLHGVLATTMPVGPVLIVNGPLRRAIGMNTGINVLGQGQRANLTIGRALQLIVRNLGEGRPGEVDRATHGNPGKVGFCFAEDEEGSPWEPLSVERGVEAGTSAVTVFAGEGPRCIVDQASREPDSLARTFAACLRTVHHPKLPMVFDAVLVVGPEHARVFAEAGWTKSQLRARLLELTTAPGEELVRGAGGIAEGAPEAMRAADVPKFRTDGLHIVHAGGRAGLFSMVIGGWLSGAVGSQIVTREVST